MDGSAFAARLVELLGVYDPDVVAVQLNLLGSHDAPRVLTVLGGDTTAVRRATLLQCLLPGAPSIYYGDEIGLAGGNDPANRGAFPWDPARWDAGLRSFVKSVLALRRAEPAFRHGSTVVIAAHRQAVAIERRLAATRLIVAVNAGDEEVPLDLALEGLGRGRLEPVALDGDDAGAAQVADVADDRVRVTVPARSGRVYRVTSEVG
jgi:glycosidase